MICHSLESFCCVFSAIKNEKGKRMRTRRLNHGEERRTNSLPQARIFSTRLFLFCKNRKHFPYRKANA
jgi:hypothetical protein